MRTQAVYTALLQHARWSSAATVHEIVYYSSRLATAHTIAQSRCVAVVKIEVHFEVCLPVSWSCQYQQPGGPSLLACLLLDAEEEEQHSVSARSTIQREGAHTAMRSLEQVRTQRRADAQQHACMQLY
jgi:hypothetical protein